MTASERVFAHSFRNGWPFLQKDQRWLHAAAHLAQKRAWAKKSIRPSSLSVVLASAMQAAKTHQSG
jgi:hypothetical protein